MPARGAWATDPTAASVERLAPFLDLALLDHNDDALSSTVDALRAVAAALPFPEVARRYEARPTSPRSPRRVEEGGRRS